MIVILVADHAASTCPGVRLVFAWCSPGVRLVLVFAWCSPGTCLDSYTCPGVRPIGVGEVLRRIIGKAVMRIIGRDLQQAAGSSQLCAGQMGGCEAAVHAMKQIFDLPEVDGVLLVDAKNAFNELNHQVTLRNVEVLCPSLAPILINTYRIDVFFCLLEVVLSFLVKGLPRVILSLWLCTLSVLCP